MRTALEKRGCTVTVCRKLSLGTQALRRQAATRLQNDMQQCDSVLVLNAEAGGVRHGLDEAMMLVVGVALYGEKPVYLFNDFPVGERGDELRLSGATALRSDLSSFS